MTLEVIRERIGSEEPCVYLPDRHSRIRYRIIEHCSDGTYERMLERGWRRFGQLYFRPSCRACGECRSLRLDVDRFQLSRSMRRNLRRNRDIDVLLRPASITLDHLSLYNRYHADMALRKGWRETPIGPFDYHRTFVEGRQGFGHELLYLDGNRLLGVALLDILPSAVSAVYCYYEPDERRRGLGVFSILQHVALARARRLPRFYLGYWIEGNDSMRYKARYHPHELLEGRPDGEEPPCWSPAQDVRHTHGA